MNIEGKKIALYGFGVSNLAFINFVIKNNCNALLYCHDDKKDLPLELKQNNIKQLNYKDWDFKNLDYIVSSPGIALEFPKEHYIFSKAKEFNVPLICDIDLFFNMFKTNKTIAVTGTNGKSTTVSLINYALNELGVKNYLKGNIGSPIFSEPNYKENSTFTLELSSFQLSLMQFASFDIALLLNITQDHTDYHGNMQNYIDAKTNIFLRNNKSSSVFITSVDDEYCKNVYNLAKEQGFNTVAFSLNQKLKNGAYIINNTLYESEKGEIINKVKLPNFYLKGKHNLQNILASYLVLKYYFKQIDVNNILNTLASFKGVKHRQELVLNHQNINFINDSKATNVIATTTALKTYNNMILLLGGNYKGDDLSLLKQYLPKVYKIHLFGNKTTDDIYTYFKQHCANVSLTRHKNIASAIDASFKDALNLSKQTSKEINVLLSPACSSFDEFKNFEERGEFFRQKVLNFYKQITTNIS